MDLYPLRFEPVYKEKIWGGTKLKEVFNRKLPNNKIGESWEVTAHPNGTSIISNGDFKGKKITSLIEECPEEMLGSKVKYDVKRRFPLLVKFLDANDKLSVQVHPDDDYAQRVEGEPGKTEMWYIIDAKVGAKLIYGLKPGTTRDELARAIRNGTLKRYLNEVEVKRGDILFIPAGTIHAIGEGILLAEIQQNSDTTYRVYDWNRPGKDGKPRPLHIDKALDIINFNQETIKAKSKPLIFKGNSYTRYFLAACPYFVTEKLDIRGSYSLSPTGERFYVIIALDGEGRLLHRSSSYKLAPGTTFFLPAALDRVTIEGQSELLLTYIPAGKREIINRLAKLGFSEKNTMELAGITHRKF